MSILCGCSWIAGGPVKLSDWGYPWGKKKKEILRWAASEKKQVDRGTLKNSRYWEEYYKKTIDLRPDLEDFLFFSAEMIKVSKIFEEGKITREQFEDKGRELQVLLTKEEDRRKQICPFDGDFGCYRGSFLIGYFEDLKTQLKTAGAQFSVYRCASFGKSIQCTTERPPFY